MAFPLALLAALLLAGGLGVGPTAAASWAVNSSGTVGIVEPTKVGCPPWGTRSYALATITGNTNSNQAVYYRVRYTAKDASGRQYNSATSWQAQVTSYNYWYGVPSTNFETAIPVGCGGLVAVYHEVFWYQPGTTSVTGWGLYKELNFIW